MQRDKSERILENLRIFEVFTVLYESLLSFTDVALIVYASYLEGYEPKPSQIIK